MKHTPLIVVLVVVLIGVGAYYFLSEQPGAGTPASSPTPPSATPGAAPVSQNTVSIQDFSFSPKVIRVTPGTKVTWRNSDIVGHTVTSDANTFASALLGQGRTFEYTFTEKGTHTYHCTPHPRMTGSVIVE